MFVLSEISHVRRHWKCKARRCIPHQREERVRFISETVASICTDTRNDTWLDVPFTALAGLVRGCLNEAGAI